MIGFLRRRAPRNPFLAALYWLVLLVVVLTVLFFVFYLTDGFLPGGGMF